MRKYPAPTNFTSLVIAAAGSPCSSSLRLLPAEDEAGAARFGHQLLLGKSDDITLEIDHGLAVVHDPRTGLEPRVRHRAQEMDRELERGERLALREERST